MATRHYGAAPAIADDLATKGYVDTTLAGRPGGLGQPTYIDAVEPINIGPLLWIKDFGGGNYALILKTP